MDFLCKLNPYFGWIVDYRYFFLLTSFFYVSFRLHRFTCIACNYAGATKGAVDLHFIRVHKFKTEQKNLCVHCGMVFMKKIFLTNHLIKAHNIDVYADGYRTYR